MMEIGWRKHYEKSSYRVALFESSHFPLGLTPGVLPLPLSVKRTCLCECMRVREDADLEVRITGSGQSLSGRAGREVV